MNKQNLFTITLGDWSGDGHCQTEMFILESNKTAKEIMDIHISSSKIYDITKLCEEYEDSLIGQEELASMPEVLRNYLDKGWFDFSEDKQAYCMYPEALLDLWVFWMRHNAPDLELYLFDLPELSIGMGYGLFL